MSPRRRRNPDQTFDGFVVNYLVGKLVEIMSDQGVDVGDAAEALWANVNDDKPVEYFQGTPLEALTMERFTVLLDHAVARLSR